MNTTSDTRHLAESVPNPSETDQPEQTPSLQDSTQKPKKVIKRITTRKTQEQQLPRREKEKR